MCSWSEGNPKHCDEFAQFKLISEKDWFDASPENRELGYQVNVKAQIEISKLCIEKKIHCSLVSSGGAFYNYDAAHPEGFSGFTESDPPNYLVGGYAQLRVQLEEELEPIKEQVSQKVED